MNTNLNLPKGLAIPSLLVSARKHIPKQHVRNLKKMFESLSGALDNTALDLGKHHVPQLRTPRPSVPTAREIILKPAASSSLSPEEEEMENIVLAEEPKASQLVKENESLKVDDDQVV